MSPIETVQLNLKSLQVLDRRISTLSENGCGDPSQLKEAMDNRAQLLRQIPQQWASLYQRVALSLGTALAEIQGNACGACFVILPYQFVIELRRLVDVRQCPSCKRILLAPRDAVK